MGSRPHRNRPWGFRLAVGRAARPGLAALLAVAFLGLPALASAEMKSVKVREANFRAGPSKDDKVKFLALRYYPVKVIKRKDQWVFVRDYEGEKAWVASWLLSDQPSVIIKSPRANIREKDTTKSETLCKAKRGWAYRVLQRKGSWVRVADEHGPVGWIHKKLLWGLEKPKKKP